MSPNVPTAQCGRATFYVDNWPNPSPVQLPPKVGTAVFRRRAGPYSYGHQTLYWLHCIAYLRTRQLGAVENLD